MTSLQELKAKLDETYKTLADTGKAMIKQELQKIFDEWPDLLAIRWTQYTPYFNDGEPCVFGVNDPEVMTKTLLAEESSEENDWLELDWDGLDWDEEYSFDQGTKERQTLKDLGAILNSAEVFLQSIFGDHVRVTIHRDKDEAEVEEYDHD